jgi:hypothetical protein
MAQHKDPWAAAYRRHLARDGRLTYGPDLDPCIGSLSIRDSIARTIQRANGLPTPAFSRL